MDMKKNKNKKLSWKTRIGFGAGDLAQNFIYQTVSFWLLFFYTNVFGLDSSLVGFIFLFVCLLDILWVPIVGLIIDKYNHKWGKYRSYLIIGGIPLTIFAVLCFWNGFSGSFVYAFLTYGLMTLSYTLVNVPYCSINSSLSRDIEEINILTSVRMFMANIGGICVCGGIPLLLELIAPKNNYGQAIIDKPESSTAWFLIMTIFAILGFIFLVFCFTQSRERILPKDHINSNMNVLILGKEFICNKYLIILFTMFLVSFCLFTISNSTSSYFIKYIVNADNKFMSVFLSFSIFPAFIIFPFLPLLRKKMSKNFVLYIFIFISIIGFLMLLATLYFNNLRNQYIYICLSQLIKSSGILVITCSIWAFIPDVVSYGEYKTGNRNAGIINSIMIIGFKIGMALGGAIPGFIFSLFSFYPNSSILHFTDELSIFINFCIIPIILLIILAVVASRFKLTDSKMLEINNVIENSN